MSSFLSNQMIWNEQATDLNKRLYTIGRVDIYGFFLTQFSNEKLKRIKIIISH